MIDHGEKFMYRKCILYIEVYIFLTNTIFGFAWTTWAFPFYFYLL